MASRASIGPARGRSSTGSRHPAPVHCPVTTFARFSHRCWNISSSVARRRKTPEEETMARDILFQEDSATRDFKFDTKVAQVFDDMVGRSVPFYAELQHMLADLTLQFTPSQDGRICDLG